MLCCITLKFVFYDRAFVKIIRISNGWYIKLKPNMSYSYEKIELCNKAIYKQKYKWFGTHLNQGNNRFKYAIFLLVYLKSETHL